VFDAVDLVFVWVIFNLHALIASPKSTLVKAASGKPVQITAHKVSGGVMSNLGLIGDEYGAGEVTGSLMTDTAQAPGRSQYFQIVVVD